MDKNFELISNVRQKSVTNAANQSCVKRILEAGLNIQKSLCPMSIHQLVFEQ